MRRLSIIAIGLFASACAFTWTQPTDNGEARIEVSVLTSRQTTQFIDADGASYSMELQAAAAAKIDRSAGRFGYTFNSDDPTSGTYGGKIDVGSDSEGLNQEAQTKIVESVVSGVVAGITKSAGVP